MSATGCDTGSRSRSRARRLPADVEAALGRRLLEDAEERLGTALVAIGDAPLLAAFVGLRQLALGVRDPLAKLGRVELRDLERLLDEDQHVVGGDLDVALALGEADHV